MFIDELLGRPSAHEIELCETIRSKETLRDQLKADPTLYDPAEATDPVAHSLVCRKRAVLNRLGDEIVSDKVSLSDERSRIRNNRTLYLLMILAAYLVAKSVISWDAIVIVGKAFGI